MDKRRRIFVGYDETKETVTVYAEVKNNERPMFLFSMDTKEFFRWYVDNCEGYIA